MIAAPTQRRSFNRRRAFGQCHGSGWNAAVAAWLIGGLGLAGPLSAEPERGYGLIAHWPFDRDLASSVNNVLYAARATKPEFIHVETSPGLARVGGGALRSNTGAKSGDAAFL